MTNIIGGRKDELEVHITHLLATALRAFHCTNMLVGEKFLLDYNLPDEYALNSSNHCINVSILYQIALALKLISSLAIAIATLSLSQIIITISV